MSIPLIIIALAVTSLVLVWLSNSYLHGSSSSHGSYKRSAALASARGRSLATSRLASFQQPLPSVADDTAGSVLSEQVPLPRTEEAAGPTAVEGGFAHQLHDTRVNRNLRVLYEISSIDRGERIVLGARRPWKGLGGDKFNLILALVDEARQFCEYGHDVTVALVTAWSLDADVRALLTPRLHCNRTAPNPMGLIVWDHYNRTLKGAFSAKHRVLVNDHVDQFDLFIHVEDDVRMTLANVHAFLDHSARLRAANLESNYFLGFTRYEVNVTGRHEHADPDVHWIWEPVFRFAAKNFQLVSVYGEPYILFVGGNPHQASWVATRDQLLALNRTCREPFLLQAHQATERMQHVEHWSGALQIFHACGRRKLVPLLDFDRFTVAHMTNNKLSYTHIQEDAVPIRVFLRRVIEHNPKWTSLAG